MFKKLRHILALLAWGQTSDALSGVRAPSGLHTSVPTKAAGCGSPKTTPARVSHRVEEHENRYVPDHTLRTLDEWASSQRMVWQTLKSNLNKLYQVIDRVLAKRGLCLIPAHNGLAKISLMLAPTIKHA